MSWFTPKKEILIGVIGMTGAGKTTFISRLTDNPGLVIGSGLESCTKDVVPVPCTIDGTRVILIDTPGFDDTYESDADIMQVIANYLATTYDKKIYLTGLILLHPINSNRLTGSEKKRTALFKDVMGPGAYQRVIIGTTMWNQVLNHTKAEEHVADRMMRADCWKDMCDRGAKVIRHEDTTASARRIVRHIVSLQETVILQMQEEMVDNDMSIWLTSAGRRVMGDLEDEIQALRAQLSKLERERFENRSEIQDLNNRVAKLTSQKSKLRSGTGEILRNFALLSSAAVPIIGLVAGSGLACTIL